MVHVIEVHALTSCDKFRLYHQGGKLEGEVNLHEVKNPCMKLRFNVNLKIKIHVLLHALILCLNV